ncbi:MAG TPA: HAMP domain-containing sensor histidine kinase [Rhizomicrobium sp.]|nr:HAMP domain-containing sensor histidine kinase [Rhizomicrobium sp.]
MLAWVICAFACLLAVGLFLWAQRLAARLRATGAELGDIRRRHEATAGELSTALEAADAGNQAKLQFLATVSHELRTQLNAIIGFSEFLGSDLCGPLSQKQRNYIGDIHRAGRHLLDLVNDALDLSKVDACQLTLEEEVCDVAVTIGGAVTMTLLRAAKADIALRTAVAAGLPPVRADQRRLRQILLNLLSNAVKFTPSGGTITVSAQRRDSGIAITVADTGIGMAPEHINVALERFGQVEERSARRFEGSGLGLPLVEQLVELHGGTFTIDSALGRGTTATVLLPADRIILRAAAA